jgi:hypothetical protein
VQRSWLGYAGTFFGSWDWSPYGAPVAGDDLLIANGGIAYLGYAFFGSDAVPTSIALTGDATHTAHLSVYNAVLQGVTVDNVTGVAGDYAPRIGTVTVTGWVVLDVKSGIYAAGNVPNGDAMNIDLALGSTLINHGGIGAAARDAMTIAGSSVSALENDGVINAGGGAVTIATNVTGTGDIYAQENAITGGFVELKGAVGAGQTVHIHRGTVQVDQPQRFLAPVDLPISSGYLALEHLDATSWSVQGGLLALFNASGGLVDTVKLTPEVAVAGVTAELQLSSFVSPTYGRGIGVTIVAVVNQNGVAPTPPTHGVIA